MSSSTTNDKDRKRDAKAHDHDHDHDDHPHDHGHDHAHDHPHDHSKLSEPGKLPHEHHDENEHEHEDDYAHGQGHKHDHSAELRQTPARRLAVALALTATFMVVELVGGYFTKSLALLSDAVHMLTDCAALAIALAAQRLALKPRTVARSYGFRRAETIAALLNGIFLAATSIWIAVEAVRRWNTPEHVLGQGMLGIAVAGLAVNLLSAWALSTGSHGHNVNTRAAMAHVLSDALGSVAAITAAALIVKFGWQRADAIASLLVSILILWGAWRLLMETTDVLMQGPPKSLDLLKLRATIAETPGVRSVHELHVWQVSDGFTVLTVHVVLDKDCEGVEVTSAVAKRVRSVHKITQVTVQPEHPEHYQAAGCESDVVLTPGVAKS